MRVTGFLGGLVVVLIVLSPGQALAAHVSCGDVITQDTTLDGDLQNCPGDGVVIGAGGITLDLAGHTIDGTGAPDGNQGVDDSAGHDGLTIEGGTIREFQADVALLGADRNRLHRLDLRSAGYGVYVDDSDANVIERNVLSGTGIFVWLGSTDNVIAGNVISTAGTAIEMHGGPALRTLGTRVEGNRVTGSGAGVIDRSSGQSRIVDNDVTDSVEAGIVASGSLDVVEGNTVSGNGLGIHVGATHVRLLRNRVTSNDGDGISVAGGSTTSTTVIERNVANANGDDGIDVDSASATITRNTANHNGDLGIEAVPGVTDGGGNKARRNGDPAQCLNVACN